MVKMLDSLTGPRCICGHWPEEHASDGSICEGCTLGDATDTGCKYEGDPTGEPCFGCGRIICGGKDHSVDPCPLNLP